MLGLIARWSSMMVGSGQRQQAVGGGIIGFSTALIIATGSASAHSPCMPPPAISLHGARNLPQLTLSPHTLPAAAYTGGHGLCRHPR